MPKNNQMNDPNNPRIEPARVKPNAMFFITLPPINLECNDPLRFDTFKMLIYQRSFGINSPSLPCCEIVEYMTPVKPNASTKE